MKNVFAASVYMVLAMTALMAGSPTVMAEKKKVNCGKNSDWHAAITCYNSAIKETDKALSEKYKALFGNDKSTMELIRKDRNAWYLHNKAACGISSESKLDDNQLLCLSAKYMTNHQLLAAYFEQMANFTNKPLAMANYGKKLEPQIAGLLKQKGLSPVVVAAQHAAPIFYVIDSNAEKHGMYFYDAQGGHLHKIKFGVGEVMDFVKNGENYLMVIKGYTRTYDVIDEAYSLVKLQRAGEEFTSINERLVASRFYARNDVCGKSNPSSGSLNTAKLVREHKFIADEAGIRRKIEIILEETDCGTSLSKTVSFEKNI